MKYYVDPNREEAFINKMFQDALFSLGEISIFDEQGKYVCVSEEYAINMGVNAQEILGKPVQEVIENTDIPNVLATGKPTKSVIYQRNGRLSLLNRFPIINQGDVIGAVGQATITDDMELEELRSSVANMIGALNYYKEKYRQTAGGESAKLMIAESRVMRDLMDTVKTVAKTRSTILITGESGTGKEVLANAIHRLSPRKPKAFIKLNCASIPESLMESELFGYEGGAFTGALRGGKIGDFEAAHGGTLMLDEVDSLSMSMQSKLLRAIQEKEIKRIGSSKTTSIDVRFIFTSNKDMKQLVEQGVFREDLYYRINVINMVLPPLRERLEDLPALVQHFIERFNSDFGMAISGVSPDALSLLQSYDWPGNIRELENCVERAFNFSGIGSLELSHFHLPITPQNHNSLTSLKAAREYAEMIAIRRALSISQGNKTKAAELLGIDRGQLYDKMKKYEIDSNHD